jgi:hypothetical protein
MKFSEFLSITNDLPVFETGLLLAGDRDPSHVRRQLSRWTKAKKVIQLKRGLYTLAQPYRKVNPHPFLIANKLVKGTYVSLQSALAYYGMIPEFVPVTLSMTTRSTASWDTPLGEFQFHHIVSDQFSGYHVARVMEDQPVYLAAPEKALLDLVHLTPGGDDPGFLASLRLQNLGQMNPASLFSLAGNRKKLRRAVDHIIEFASLEEEGYKSR